MDASDSERPKDRRNAQAMKCEKSDTGTHHFVLRADKNWVQRLECRYCGVVYDHAVHSSSEEDPNQ